MIDKLGRRVGRPYRLFDYAGASDAERVIMMMTSELLRNGPGRIHAILADMAAWREDHVYDSVAQMRGCMCQQPAPDPAAFERANYMKGLQSWRPDPARQYL